MSEEVNQALSDAQHTIAAIRARWESVCWAYAQNSLSPDYIADAWIYAEDLVIIDLDEPNAGEVAFLRLAAQAPGDVRTLLAEIARYERYEALWRMQARLTDEAQRRAEAAATTATGETAELFQLRVQLAAARSDRQLALLSAEAAAIARDTLLAELDAARRVVSAARSVPRDGDLFVALDGVERLFAALDAYDAATKAR